MLRSRWLHVAIAIGVVAFVVARSHPEQLRAALGDIDVRLALLAVALNLPVALLAPLRSSLLFRRLGYVVPAGVLIPSTILGFVAGSLTPAAAGELLRVAALRDRAGVDSSDTLAVVVYERAMALYVLLLSSVAAFAVTQLPAAAAGGLVVATSVAVLAPLALPRLGGRLLSGDAERQRLSILPWLREMLRQLSGLLRYPGTLLAWSAVTLAMLALIALQYWLLAEGVGGGVSYGEAWLALGISTFAASLSLLPLAIGVLDGSLAVALERLGMSLEQGQVVALLVRATVTLPLVAAAFGSYLYLEQRNKGIREQRNKVRRGTEERMPGAGES